MRYLSLFDGIGAAAVAWDPLGWECVGVSEIDPFPMAVTNHHRPDVPHLGDITKITEQQVASLGRIDLVVGGFPCQDLSVAGKRQGLRNEDGALTRSGLFYDAIRIVRSAVQRCGCRWLLIENVPGLFSSNGGRDFAAVVGTIVGTEFDVPRDGWRNSGVAVGPEGLAEWCTLDAQFFGLAQRRKRVFVVGHLGDWRRAAAVLFDAASLRGDTAPRREAGEGVAPPIAGCSNGGGANGPGRTADDCEALIPQPHAAISPALKARDSKGVSSDGDGDGDGAILVPMVAHSLRASGFDASEDGTGHGTPLVPVAFDQHYAPAGVTMPLMAGGSGGRNEMNQSLVGVPVAFDTTQCTSKANRSNPQAGDPCHPLAAGAHAPAIAFHGSQDPDVLQYGDKTGPLDTDGHTMGILKGANVHADATQAGPVEALRTLRREIGAEAFARWGLGILASLRTAEVLQPDVHGAGIRPASFSRSWVVCCALGSPFTCAEGAVQSVREAIGAGCASQGRQSSEQFARELGAYLSGLSQPGAQAERFMRDLWQADEGVGLLRQALSAIQDSRRSAGGESQSAPGGMQVRRLTVMECEFLQGFPRGYTAIPYRGKSAADGPRYKALGNSFAVPVVRWIGQRIAMVEGAING